MGNKNFLDVTDIGDITDDIKFVEKHNLLEILRPKLVAMEDDFDEDMNVFNFPNNDKKTLFIPGRAILQINTVTAETTHIFEFELHHYNGKLLAKGGIPDGTDYDRDSVASILYSILDKHVQIAKVDISGGEDGIEVDIVEEISAKEDVVYKLISEVMSQCQHCERNRVFDWLRNVEQAIKQRDKTNAKQTS
jgi:hypothetical protein